MPGGKLTPPGWFSRRHQTRKEHDAAVAQYKEKHGRQARRRRAAEREGAAE